ncbi:MAG: hypothetical protein HOH92_07905, partial [Crocinitomicaceae bacterium]|nr:hypothetical protein [Crocinitomicaceae bacterium]
GWNFLLWGVLSGLMIILLDPIIDAMARTKVISLIILSRCLMILAGVSSLVFFRGKNLNDAVQIFQALGKWDVGAGETIESHYLLFGLGINELFVSVSLIGIVLLVECIQEYRPEVHRRFYQGHRLFRWSSALVLSFGIVLLGFYDGREGAGNAKDDLAQEEFIYEQF